MFCFAIASVKNGNQPAEGKMSPISRNPMPKRDLRSTRRTPCRPILVFTVTCGTSRRACRAMTASRMTRHAIVYFEYRDENFFEAAWFRLYGNVKKPTPNMPELVYVHISWIIGISPSDGRHNMHLKLIPEPSRRYAAIVLRFSRAVLFLLC